MPQCQGACAVPQQGGGAAVPTGLFRQLGGAPGGNLQLPLRLPSSSDNMFQETLAFPSLEPNGPAQGGLAIALRPADAPPARMHPQGAARFETHDSRICRRRRGADVHEASGHEAFGCNRSMGPRKKATQARFS